MLVVGVMKRNGLDHHNVKVPWWQSEVRFNGSYIQFDLYFKKGISVGSQTLVCPTQTTKRHFFVTIFQRQVRLACKAHGSTLFPALTRVAASPVAPSVSGLC